MNKTVLITGASGGIGLELSKIFASEGYDVLLVARSEDKLLELSRKIEKKYGVRAYVLSCDLSAENAALEVYGYCKEQGIDIYALVNNAGFGDTASFAECDWKKQSDMVKLNIIALMQLTKCFLPDMIEKREGRILNIASVASLCAGPYMSVYYATKAFVRSFSEAVAEEVKEYGVTVTALCPGPVDTGFEKAANVGSALAFNALTLADPRDVALCGYRAMMKGKTLTYYGVAAKAMALAVRVLPRSTARRVAGKLNKNG